MKINRVLPHVLIFGILFANFVNIAHANPLPPSESVFSLSMDGKDIVDPELNLDILKCYSDSELIKVLNSFKVQKNLNQEFYYNSFFVDYPIKDGIKNCTWTIGPLFGFKFEKNCHNSVCEVLFFDPGEYKLGITIPSTGKTLVSDSFSVFSEGSDYKVNIDLNDNISIKPQAGDLLANITYQFQNYKVVLIVIFLFIIIVFAVIFYRNKKKTV